MMYQISRESWEQFCSLFLERVLEVFFCWQLFFFLMIIRKLFFYIFNLRLYTQTLN